VPHCASRLRLAQSFFLLIRPRPAPALIRIVAIDRHCSLSSVLSFYPARLSPFLWEAVFATRVEVWLPLCRLVRTTTQPIVRRLRFVVKALQIVAISQFLRSVDIFWCGKCSGSPAISFCGCALAPFAGVRHLAESWHPWNPRSIFFLHS